MSSCVLITRPGFSETTSAAIRARGYDPVSAPFLTIESRAVALPAGVQAILVSSSNALPSLTSGNTRLFAVGNATAERARTRGFPDVLSAAGDAEALGALVAREADPTAGPLFLASGAGQGLTLAANLRRRGFRVVRRVCYVAIPVKKFPEPAAQALRSGNLHAALFMSAETAKIFARLLPPALHASLGRVAAVAIAPAVAAALEGLPWHHVCAARTPTLDDVLALL